MKKTYLMILIELFLYIVGGNVLSVTIQDITLRLSEIFSFVLGLALIGDMFSAKLDKSILYILLWSILSFVLLMLNKFIYSFTFSELVVALLYLFRFFYSIFLTYLVSRYICKNRRQIDVLKYINKLYIIVCFIGFFQLVFFPVAFDWYGIFEKIGVDWQGDPHINRLVSTDFDPNYLSSCLLLGVVVNFYLLKNFDLIDNKPFSSKCIKRYFIFAIYIVTILLTKSRSGLVGLIISISIFLLLSVNYNKIKVKYLLLAFILLFAVICLFLFSNISVFVRIRNFASDPSAKARFNSWAKGYEIMVKTYFMGIGYNFYPAYNSLVYDVVNTQSGMGTDSSLELIIITTGIIGLILFSTHLIKLWKKIPNEIKSVLVASLVISNFNNLLFYSLWVFPFYLIVYIFVLSKREGKNEWSL
ncbi:MAG: O-antigen ligase family protein [Clostridia bacterium]|nr:O-antigen ligase family protein [Clostridia bacterium]